MVEQKDIAVEIARKNGDGSVMCSEKTSTTLPEKKTSGRLMSKEKGAGERSMVKNSRKCAKTELKVVAKTKDRTGRRRDCVTAFCAIWR